MSQKGIKKTGGRKVKSFPTVKHESSTESEQIIPAENVTSEKDERASHRRKHNGSDGADQERGSNH